MVLYDQKALFHQQQHQTHPTIRKMDNELQLGLQMDMDNMPHHVQLVPPTELDMDGLPTHHIKTAVCSVH